MTSKTLTDLAPDNALTGDEVILGIQNGKPVRMTATQLLQASAPLDGESGASVLEAASDVTAAAASASAAAGSAAAAAQSAANAAASVGPASTSKANAAISESQTATSAAAALASRTATEQSRDAARTSSVNASNTTAPVLATAVANNLTAAAQAARAMFQADKAASLAQQDLSGVTLGALHRSPNAIVATVIYDTSKDSDGGAWVENCSRLSWMNEALNGNWLATDAVAGFQSELEARTSGATLGAEMVTGGDFADATALGNWTFSNCTGAVVNGQFVITATAAGLISAKYLGVGLPLGGLYASAVTVAATPPRTLQIWTRGVKRDAPTSGVSRNVVVAGSAVEVIVLQTTTAQVGDVFVVDNVTVRPITAFNTNSGDYYPDATTGKFYRLWKNLLPFSENGLSNWTKNGTPVVTPSGGTVGGIAADLISTAGSNAGVYKLAVATAYGAGDTFSFQARIKYVSGTTTTRLRLEGAAFPSLSGIIFDAQAGTYVNGTGIAPVAVTVTATNDGGWLVTMTCRAEAAGPVNVTVYSVDTNPHSVLVTALQLERGNPTAYEPKAGIADSTVSEAFRGNTAKFPRLAALVEEAASLTIYALDQPGRPMWMRLFSAGATQGVTNMHGGVGTLNSGLVILNGVIYLTDAVGSGGYTLRIIDFTKDYAEADRPSGGSRVRYNGTIAQRNAGLGWTNFGSNRLASSTANAVAVMARPTAPLDPVTGLPIPTIGVAVGTGNAGNVGSVIMDDGSVVNYSTAGNDGSSVAFTARGEVVWGVTSATGSLVMPLATANVTNLFSNVPAGARAYTASVGTGTSTKKVARPMSGTQSAIFGNNGGEKQFFMVKDNPSGGVSQALLANITGTYNTGWMPGDIRRAMFIDTVVGVAGSTVTFLAGDDATFTNSLGAWTIPYQGTGAAVGGQAVITSNGTPYFGRNFTGLIPGYAYRFDFDLVGRSNAAAVINLFVGDAAGALANTKLGNFGQQTNGVGKSIVFTANETGVAFIQFNMTGAVAGDTFTVDNVQVTQCFAADRSAKTKPATINGSLTRTAVAAASQMVAWGGFSNDPIVEMVANGGGSGSQFVDTSGWLASTSPNNVGGILSVVSGNLRLQNDATGTHWGIYQYPIQTTPGRTYQVTIGKGPNGTSGVFQIGTSLANPSSIRANVAVGAGGATTTFVAITTTSYIGLQNSGNQASAFTEFSLVSVKGIDAINSAANVAQEPWSADHDPALAAFGGSAWFNVPATGFGPANFLTFSEDATYASYNRNAVTITANVDGTADKVARQVNVSGYLATGTPAALNNAGSYGYRVRAKQGAVGGRIGLRVQGTYPNRVDALFDLTNGTLVTSSASGTATGVVASISPAVDQPGYYDLTLAGTLADAFGQCLCSPCDATWATATGFEGNVAATTAAEAIIARQQVSRGLVLPPYTATNGTQFNGIAPIYDRSAPTGAYYRWGIDANGMLACELSDGTNVRRVTTTQTVNSGTWIKGEWAYVPNGANTTLTLKVNGAQQTQVTGAALLTLSNANALMTYGQARTLDAAFPGQLAMVKPTMTIPTQEQTTFMYEQERQMFRDGAQVTLADTGNLVDLTYDKLDQSVSAASSTYKSKFVGLVRTQSEAPIAGSFTGVTNTNGIKLLTRSLTTPGVDISYDSRRVLEELVNRDASAPAGNILTGFDYDSIAGQTDFALPIGWTAVKVISASSVKREGSSKDWTRVFDGFIETIRFAVAPGTGVWVRILAKRS